MRGDFSVNRENTMLAKYTVGVVQEVFGADSRIAVRAPAALAGLLTGVVLLLAGRRIGGWPAGMIAFALWCFLPRPEVVGDFDVGRIQIERYFRLEVFLGLFVALALYAAWRWSEKGSWRWAVAAGVSVGLATASKAPGILVLPAVMLAGLLAQPLGRRSLLQAAAVALLAILTLLVTYIPLGTDGFDAIERHVLRRRPAQQRHHHAVRLLRAPLREPALVGQPLVAVEQPRSRRPRWRWAPASPPRRSSSRGGS